MATKRPLHLKITSCFHIVRHILHVLYEEGCIHARIKKKKKKKKIEANSFVWIEITQ